jgi:hypothetical protein
VAAGVTRAESGAQTRNGVILTRGHAGCFPTCPPAPTVGSGARSLQLYEATTLVRSVVLATLVALAGCAEPTALRPPPDPDDQAIEHGRAVAPDSPVLGAAPRQEVAVQSAELRATRSGPPASALSRNRRCSATSTTTCAGRATSRATRRRGFQHRPDHRELFRKVRLAAILIGERVPERRLPIALAGLAGRPLFWKSSLAPSAGP